MSRHELIAKYHEYDGGHSRYELVVKAGHIRRDHILIPHEHERTHVQVAGEQALHHRRTHRLDGRVKRDLLNAWRGYLYIHIYMESYFYCICRRKKNKHNFKVNTHTMSWRGPWGTRAGSGRTPPRLRWLAWQVDPCRDFLPEEFIYKIINCIYILYIGLWRILIRSYCSVQRLNDGVGQCANELLIDLDKNRHGAFRRTVVSI